MKQTLFKSGAAVVALIFAISAFSVSANMCYDPAWAAFHADGGMVENECDIEQEWISGYYAAAAGGTFSNAASHSLADFVIVESPQTSQLIISRVDGTSPVVTLNGGRYGPYTDTMSIGGGTTVRYRLSASDQGVLTIHYHRKKVLGNAGVAVRGTVKATFKAR